MIRTMMIAGGLATLLVLLACGGSKETKTPPKEKNEVKESPAKPEAPAATPGPVATPSPAATDAAPASQPAATSSAPEQPTINETESPPITDMAVPPSVDAPKDPLAAFMDPDGTKWADYVIKTKDGSKFTVKWFWKRNGKVVVQKAGGQITLSANEIASIEGRKD